MNDRQCCRCLWSQYPAHSVEIFYRETENELCQIRHLGENNMKLRDDGKFDDNNYVHCADDGVDHGDCSDLSKVADGIGAYDGVGVDDGDCSDLSEGGDKCWYSPVR